jgi:hypothetical protein
MKYATILLGAIRHGKWTNFYDRQGRYSGSVIDTSPRR